MIRGSLVAIVTPMKDDTSIDWEGFKRLIDFHLQNGTDGIVVTGTTGESATLEPESHIECIKFVVDNVNKKIPVIAGTGANSTSEAIFLAQEAKSAGADAHLSVVPYYNKPNQRGILAHFSAIAEACDLPLILYNVPGRTASDIAVETVLELSRIPHVVGIKEASSIERCRELLSACSSDFAIYCGEDPINCQIISEGAAGAISVTANVAPQAVADVCRLASTNFDAAKAIDDKIKELHTRLFVEPSPAPTKWALSQMGLINNKLRLPLVELDSQFYPIIEEALNKAGILTTTK